MDDSKIKRAQEAHVCHNFKILDNKPVVDLVKQNAAFSLEVGQYKGVLSVLDSNGCGANVVKPSLTLIWTLAPEEILGKCHNTLLSIKFMCFFIPAKP